MVPNSFRVTLLGLCVLVIVHPARAQDAAPAAPPTDGVEAFLRSYTAAFAGGDASVLAEFWTEDAEWESTSTGEAAEGRDQILADFQTFFDGNPGAKLTGSIDSQKVVAPGVICLDGQTTLMRPDGGAIQGVYHAVLTSQHDKWRLAKVVESAPPALEDSSTKLEPLGFLIGQWLDEGDGPTVTTTFRWGVNKTFLIRTFTIVDEEQSEQGTQVIGWDPVQNCLRSWSFFSDGSFGGGTWTHPGDGWNGRLWQTLIDGATCSGTQVIRLVDNDTLEVENVGRDIDGEPLPSLPPIRMVRVDDAVASDDASQVEGE